MMKESFRFIKFNESYMVSDHGSIISLKENNFKFLKQSETGNGYLSVGLSYGGKTDVYLVHRLVAEAFIGDTTNMTVNHIDENKRNNNLSNLEICTQKENVNHSSNRDEYNSFVCQRNINGEIIAVWPSINFAHECGFARASVRKCCKGLMESYNNFKWTFDIVESELINSHFIDMRDFV